MPVFNAICLGSVLYSTGLVPRILPAIGLIGAPLLLASDIAIFFGLYDRMAPIAALAAIPIAVWEFSLGIYLTVKGFRPTAVQALTANLTARNKQALSGPPHLACTPWPLQGVLVIVRYAPGHRWVAGGTFPASQSCRGDPVAAPKDRAG